MNWKNGILRLWVILSLFWLGSTPWVFEDHIFTTFEIPQPKDGAGGVTLTPGKYECWATQQTHNPFVLKDSTFDPRLESPSNLTLRQAWITCVNYKLRTLLDLLTVPIAMFFSIFAAAWVISGFKSKP